MQIYYDDKTDREQFCENIISFYLFELSSDDVDYLVDNLFSYCLDYSEGGREYGSLGKIWQKITKIIGGIQEFIKFLPTISPKSDFMEASKV